MYRTLYCLTHDHAIWAVPLATLVCWISCHAAMRLSQHARVNESGRGPVWLAGAGVTAGIGIWSTHFIAMLGYDPGIGVGYDLPLTALSLAVAATTASLALALAQRTTRVLGSALAGVLLGLGVAAMHFTGMAGIRVSGTFIWHLPLVAVALTFGCGLTAAALVVIARPIGRYPHVLAASLLTGGIACLHFLAIAAVEVMPDPSRVPQAESLPRGVLALGVAAGMLAILAVSALALFAERLRRANRVLREGKNLLREKTKLLDAILEAMDQGLLMTDADDRVRVYNGRVAGMTGVSASLLYDGAPFAAVRKHQALQGEFIHLPDHLRRWLESGESEMRVHDYERERPNGVVLQIHTVPVATGGVVRTFTDVTARRAAERALRESEARYRALADALPQLVWTMTEDTGEVSYVNRRFADYYGDIGISREDRLARNHLDDAERMEAAWTAACVPRVAYEVEGRLRRYDGVYRWHKLIVQPIERGGSGNEWLGTALDIDDLIAARRSVEEATDLLRLAQDAAGAGVWEWDIGDDSVRLSPASAGLHGLDGRENPDAPVVMPLAEWKTLVRPEDRPGLWSDVKRALASRAAYSSEFRIQASHTYGDDRWLQSFGRVVCDERTGRAVRMVGLHIDITSRKEAARQIAHMAVTDPLTGLPNRTLFRDRLDHALAAARDSGLAVLLCDLDRFKAINDTMGHPAGDAVLRVIAERLSAVVRAGDTVARLGGDEFAIILGRIDTPQGAGHIAERVIRAVEEQIDVNGQSASIGVSIGIAMLAPGMSVNGIDAEALYRRADTAMYRAKALGRNTYSFYEPGMDAAVSVRTALERDLREAIRTGALALHYQPIVRLDDGATSGFEALLRWPHPERGMISPADFIPLAEETGLIVPLGEWALREACREAASWPDGLRIAVNVSAVQFRRPGLERAVLGALADSGLAPHRLELEITESVLIEDGDAVVACLHRLREIGVRTALDDFGVGYSSLSYLRRFPFSKIKIDRSFIDDIHNPDTAAIVQAIVFIGVRLGATITAEGVERAEQLERVKEIGCTEVQGYLLSRPLPTTEARLFAEADRVRAAA